MTITVDEYINSFYQQIQINLIKLRKIIKETAPEAQEKISWGVPTYFQDGFLVQFHLQMHFPPMHPPEYFHSE